MCSKDNKIKIGDIICPLNKIGTKIVIFSWKIEKKLIHYSKWGKKMSFIIKKIDKHIK